jgi:hypothetical protein
VMMAGVVLAHDAIDLQAPGSTGAGPKVVLPMVGRSRGAGPLILPSSGP